MDKIKNYKKIVQRVLEERAAKRLGNSPGAIGHLVMDKEKNEFVLLWVGWSGDDYTHGLMFHVGIKDGKVRVYEDRTDIDIADVLSKAGIPKSEIVLEFVAPNARDLSGFATA